ncbi:uncharacterized protein [Triticum aestivum]|uniref:uncharacterized protein n=1 Tax=Triticum aestivum TaxID=4565 RepID=UPI001D004515|nr:uncharacterized protein LOC123070698 isoform X2 [Triticum aestivum]XP_044428560.1 uncharacterized protein LOC123153544 [Triticum aestivum]
MNQTGAAISPAAGNTHLGPLGHLPPPTYQPTLPTHPPSATLLAPTSIIDTITDVSPFIPIVLDLAAHNYYHWRHLFLVHLGRCGLRSHIDGDNLAASSDPVWIKDDFAILQWIYTRISTELFGLLPKDGATAFVIWRELQRLFQDNRDARINHLETAMRTLKQRDEPVGTYCQRLKAMADELHELGAPVDDRRLISATLAGISERFDKVTSVIPLLRPAPPYSEVLSMLQLEETKLRTRMEQPQAFYSNNGPCNSGNAAQAPSPQQPAVRPTGVSPNYKGKNPVPGFQHRNASNNGSTSTTPSAHASPAPPRQPAATPTAPMTPPWRAHTDPWTGLVQAWPVPWTQATAVAAPGPVPWQLPSPRLVGGPGLLGRPPAQAYYSFAQNHQPAPATYPASPFAPPAYAAAPMQAPMYAPPTTPASPAWDQAALVHALNAYTNHNDGGWIVDSGATAHMSGSQNPGPDRTT